MTCDVVGGTQMRQKGYQTNAEYIESMMKQFKLVDMREQYRDLILKAESSAMDYESFLVRLLAVVFHEVILHGFKTLADALSDSNAWYDHDKLAPAERTNHF